MRPRFRLSGVTSRPSSSSPVVNTHLAAGNMRADGRVCAGTPASQIMKVVGAAWTAQKKRQAALQVEEQ